MPSPHATSELDRLMELYGIISRASIDVWLRYDLDDILCHAVMKGISDGSHEDNTNIVAMLMLRLVEHGYMALQPDGSFVMSHLVN